jgi:hypothetical protein
LSDDQFARIEHLLPGRPGHVGRNSDKGNRLFVDFALYCERNLVERFCNIIKHFPDGPKAAFGRVCSRLVSAHVRDE